MIVPALDLFQMKIVRLYQGKYEKIKFYDKDIYQLLSYYQSQGAQLIHLVDLSGAQNPKNNQFKFLMNIIKNSPIPIQLGGGIRKIEQIEQFFLAGVKRIVIGSSAIEKFEDVKHWFKEFGGNVIVLALDLNITQNNHKEIRIHAWEQSTSISLEHLINIYSEYGLKNILCTDISKDGTLKGPNIKLYTELVHDFPHIYFQSSGGIGTLSDISEIKKTKVKDVIIGKALLENKFSLKEAISCWQSELFHV